MNKSCELHERGHSTDECITLKKRAREQQSSSGTNQQRNTFGDYQPNFNNRQFTADVTRLFVNNTQIARTSDPSAWIVDSVANAFITPFKERLHNYRHFKNQVQVKDFDGKPEVAVGSGSITLTDYRGNRQTLNNVVYVPGCTEQILSLMKLHRLYGADFAFTSLEEFKIPFPNGVFFPGRSVNDVLYIWESTSFVSNAVTICSASQKRKIVEINDDDVDVEDDNTSLGSETFHLNIQPIGEPEQLTNFQFLPIGERERQLATTSSSSPLSTTSHCPVKPLYCSPNQLWHLHFGHASTTTLCKLPYIKSSHDLTRCVVCIRAKQARKLFLPFASEVSRKLE